MVTLVDKPDRKPWLTSIATGSQRQPCYRIPHARRGRRVDLPRLPHSRTQFKVTLEGSPMTSLCRLFPIFPASLVSSLLVSRSLDDFLSNFHVLTLPSSDDDEKNDENQPSS